MMRVCESCVDRWLASEAAADKRSASANAASGVIRAGMHITGVGKSSKISAMLFQPADAIRGITDRASAHESRHGGPSNPAQIDPDDAQDVVDHMNQMDRSGRIDMDAYRGERNDDDEPETLGEVAREPDDVDSRGNRPRNNY